MLHKKNISLLVAATLITFCHNTFAMDGSPLKDQKAQAKIDLLKKQLETEELRKNLATDLNAKEAMYLQAKIDEKKVPAKIKEGLIVAVKEGIAGTISNTGTYYFKKKIDLWMDGSLTTAELLAELNAREEYLGKQLINIKASAHSHAEFLSTEEKIAFNAKTKTRLEDIEAERDENNRLYKKYVSNKKQGQSFFGFILSRLGMSS